MSGSKYYKDQVGWNFSFAFIIINGSKPFVTYF